MRSAGERLELRNDFRYLSVCRRARGSSPSVSSVWAAGCLRCAPLTLRGTGGTVAEFPALPLFTDAFMADCDHLTDAERGRYIHLLMVMWRSPKCRVPNDDAWLAKRFHRSIEQFQIDVRPVIAEFCNSDGNWITQKRLTREFRYVTERSQKQSERAKLRWNKGKNDAHAYAATGIAASGIAPTPTPTPTPTQRKKDTSLRSAPNGAPTRSDLEREFYEFGKKMLGKNSGGLLTSLLKAKHQDISAARPILELAATKADPREYVAAACKPTPLPGSRDELRERNANAYRKLCEFVDANTDDKGRGGRPGEAPLGLLPGAQRPRS
jgi:uncharacterized protein YdaU (DUF1376 family)